MFFVLFRSLYAGLWSLGDGTDEELVKKAIAEEVNNIFKKSFHINLK